MIKSYLLLENLWGSYAPIVVIGMMKCVDFRAKVLFLLDIKEELFE